MLRLWQQPVVSHVGFSTPSRRLLRCRRRKLQPSSLSPHTTNLLANPYWGEAMLRCGEVVRDLSIAAALSVTIEVK